MTQTISGYRVRFVIDDTARFEEYNGKSRPLTEDEYKGQEYRKDGQDVPYAEYRRYYGNPDRHVYLGCELQKECTCCGTFKTVESLWNIDCMDDNPEFQHVQLRHWYSLGEVLDDVKLGYLREVARDLAADTDG